MCKAGMVVQTKGEPVKSKLKKILKSTGWVKKVDAEAWTNGDYCLVFDDGRNEYDYRYTIRIAGYNRFSTNSDDAAIDCVIHVNGGN